MSPLDLLGTWALDRVVDDHLAGERRTVVGSTSLVEVEPGRVRWSEVGTMTWPGHAVPVSRTLEVVRDAAADAWVVHFEDGRVFHRWAVGETVEHPCRPDHYTGRIETQAEPGGPVERWQVTWEARGPEKDYRMVTVHRRPA